MKKNKSGEKIEYYDTGETQSEIWATTQLGVETIHRNDGPSWILYNKLGEIIEDEWFWCGVIMTCTQWLEVSDGPKEILIQIKLTNRENDAEKTLLSETIIKGRYIKRVELVDGEEFRCDDFEVEGAYTLSGDYIGDCETADYIIVKMEISPEKKSPGINICTIGF